MRDTKRLEQLYSQHKNEHELHLITEYIEQFSAGLGKLDMKPAIGGKK